MKAKQIFALEPGQKINHEHYGVCTVEEIIPDFGPTLIPDTYYGKMVLKKQTDTVKMFRDYPIGTPLLETTIRLILNKIEK